jgi:hypothetical protein
MRKGQAPSYRAFALARKDLPNDDMGRVPQKPQRVSEVAGSALSAGRSRVILEASKVKGAAMSQRKSVSFTSVFFLQLALGMFFLMLGIMGLGNYNSDLSKVARWFGRDDTLRVIMSVVELIMGGILLLGLFISVGGNIARVFSFALFILWALYMVMNFVLNDSFLEPSTVVWLYNVSWNAVILVGLWVVGRKYMA